MAIHPDAEAIAQERERRREIFRKAYGKFGSLVHGSKVKVQNPENFDHSVGIHFDALCWMRDFRLAGFRILHGVQQEIFVAHYYDHLNLPVRQDARRGLRYRRACLRDR